MRSWILKTKRNWREQCLNFIKRLYFNFRYDIIYVCNYIRFNRQNHVHERRKKLWQVQAVVAEEAEAEQEDVEEIHLQHPQQTPLIVITL